MKTVKCINNEPLKGNDVAPPLKVGDTYTVKEVFIEDDQACTAHYDVGLVSEFNYISSRTTGDHLPNSGQGGVHWCSPDRFEDVN